MSLNLIRTLLHLAQSDGSISGSEMALINKIAVAKGLPMFEVDQLTNAPLTAPEDLDLLSSDEKYEYIYTIILMAKMDGRLDDRELEACNQYAGALGYEDGVIPRLLEMVKSDHELNENKEELKNEIQKYLKS